MLRRVILFLSPFLLIPAVPAQAQLAAPVRAMIDAAMETNDAEKVRVVVDLAKQTNPDDAKEIDALQAGFRQRQRQLADARSQVRQEALRDAGLFDNWSGKGQIGGFRSSGNSNDVGVSASLELRRTGIDWTHLLRGTADYQRSNGRTSRERYLAAYEPRFVISPRLFAYGLTQYEKDRFAGFQARYSASGGLGYEVLRGEPKLSVQAGPAYRRTEGVDGTVDTNLGALAGLEFSWRIIDGLRLTQDTDYVTETGGRAQAVVGGNNTSLLLVTGLEATIRDGLTTRLTYQVDYNSNPPGNAVNTNTITRFSLVYGF
jgi:putative salt-induced outer membrane protein